MASLAEMERELIVERTRAGLEVAKQLGRKGGRKPKMTDSKIESAKKLLASGVPPKDVARTLACRFRRSTTGCQPPRTLSVLYFPFSETTPFIRYAYREGIFCLIQSLTVRARMISFWCANFEMMSRANRLL